MTDITGITPHAREVELTHPVTEDGIGMYFTLLPTSSDEVKKAEREYLNARLAKRKNQITAESLEAAKIKQIMAAVTDWRFEGDANIGGEKPEFSKRALKDLITSHDWIKNFLDRELGDEPAFFTASGNS